MSHTCHAYQCEKTCKPEMFMCLYHWRRVPKHLQRAIWATYRPGQEADKRITRLYADAAKQAIRAVAEKDGLVMTGEELELKMYDYFAEEQ